MSHRTRISAVVAAAVVVVGGTVLAAALADNGATHGSQPPDVAPTGAGATSGTSMPMPEDAQQASQRPPTEAATMVCGDEIHEAVEGTFDVEVPAGASTWEQGRLYRCTYRLPQGPLTLSVKDVTGSDGRAYFNAVRAFDGEPALLTGLQAFGLPSYETKSGKVVFLKDGKTLVVDAGRLREPVGPHGETRSEVAYAIAADVIGCWSE